MSRTAASMPVINARATIEWPMLSSSISAHGALGRQSDKGLCGEPVHPLSTLAWSLRFVPTVASTAAGA